MKVVILSARPGWHNDELCRALRERGHAATVLPYEGLVARLGSARPEAKDGLSSAGIPMFDADAVLARIIPGGSLEQIIFRVDSLHWLEERGIVVMNSPRAIERCVDKFYTDALMREAGLPTPETIVCDRADEAMAAVRALGDVVIKPIFGSMGQGIVRVSDPDTAYRVIRPLEQMKAIFYVQRAVDHGGRDLRVFVVGGAVIGAIERRAAEGEWRSNVSRGASTAAVDLPAETRSLAVQAAAAVGADYAGVDLLTDREGRMFVLEVNGIPGWEGLQKATGIDVAGAIIDHLGARVSGARMASVELRV